MIGHRRMRRLTQVSMLLIRLSREGGNQPFFWLRRLEKRGFRYLVLRFLRPRRTTRRSDNASLMSWPRWVSSAANTTCPDVSFTRANPVVLLPGSILILNGKSSSFSLAVFKMIVKGYLFKTAAFF